MAMTHFQSVLEAMYRRQYTLSAMYLPWWVVLRFPVGIQN